MTREVDYQLPAIGTICSVGPENDPHIGTLTGILIEEGFEHIRATYRVAFWVSGKRTVEYFEPSEVGFDKKKKTFTIGFHNGE